MQVVDADASGWWRQVQALPGTLQPALVSVAAGGSLELDDCSLLAGGRDRDVLRAKGKGQDQAPAVAAAAARAGRSGSQGGGGMGGSGERRRSAHGTAGCAVAPNSCVASLAAAVHLDCCVPTVSRRGASRSHRRQRRGPAGGRAAMDRRARGRASGREGVQERGLAMDG